MPTRPQTNLTTVFLTLALASPLLGAQKIYWTDTFTAKIQRANPDGTNVEDLVTTGLELPRGIALDVAGGIMYWTDSGTNALGRCNLDGSDCEELVTGLFRPRGIALDLAAGRMYWASRRGGMIRRANLDGTGTDAVVTGLADPMGVALDLLAGKVYWAHSGGRAIQRANLDGSDVESFVTGLTSPTGIGLDLDPAGQKVYWTDFGRGVIQRASLDGTNIETLVTGLFRPMGLALDLDGEKMYWTEAGPGSSEDFDGKIQRANLDGSGVEPLITTGLRNPREIAILPDPCVDGAPCDDDNRCTADDVCIDGICVGEPSSAPCDDGNPCTAGDACNSGTCAGMPAGGTCDDGDSCTQDICVAGACVGTQNYDIDTCFHYSLRATQVNGVACPSCPTSNLPASEVRPGDTITIETYLANWAPQVVGVAQWTIDASTFESGNGASGFLSLPNVSCSTDADCHEAFVQSSGCTCNGSECEVNGFCDVRAVAFINSSRLDYVFPGGFMCLGEMCAPDFWWSGGVGFTLDPGHPVYVGTLILTASSDVRGTFTIAMLDSPSDTFVNPPGFSTLRLLQLQPLVINFCDVVDSPNDCNNNDLPDECEPDRDGDGLIDECDPCPDDPSDTTGFDADADGVLDCNDECPGVDDVVFAPTCVGAIPTASEWGLVAMTLLLLTGGKICFGLRRARLGTDFPHTL